MSNPPSIQVAVVYHSAQGHTRSLAEAVARGVAEVDGVHATLLSVDDDAAPWDALEAADAIVFGCPTYMGSASGAFKSFMDESARIWAIQGWRDKLAAGFTHSAALSGDKLGTLLQLAVFAAQHGMLWVGLGLPPTYAAEAGEADGVNRLGSHLGAMAQSRPGWSSSEAPPASDRRTAELLGRRVAEAARRWTSGPPPGRSRSPGAPKSEPVTRPRRHPTALTWSFPDPARPELPAPLSRTNLRELAARPGRLEHHLMVVARLGKLQLELATASEPLYFAHANISDELAITLPTGDPMIDGFRARTLLTEPVTREDVGRILQRAGDVVLHPYGLLHWPGRLRPPFQPFEFPPGMRRAGLTLVACASCPCAPSDADARPLFVSAERASDAKAYGGHEVPFLLADTHKESGRGLASVAGTTLELVIAPQTIAPPRGGYVVVMDVEEGAPHAATDLVHVPAGASWDARGVRRALVFSAVGAEPEAPPATWRAVPALPFPAYEDGVPGALPVTFDGLSFEPLSETQVLVRNGSATAEVPRYWLARTLYRIALHGFRLGYVETYGGFVYSDAGGQHRMGLSHGDPVPIAASELSERVERIYRAVAPAGYTERLG